MAKIKNNKNKVENFTVTIDPYERTAYRFTDQEVSIVDLNKSIPKNGYFISYLKFKDIATSTIAIPMETSEEDLQSAVSIKAYEELSLDASLDYKIVFTEVQSQMQGNDKLFNVFAVDTSFILKTFQDIVKKTTFMDTIVAAPLLYGSLYKKAILQNNSVDCFICLEKDDAFLSIYINGEYFTSRPIRFNLGYIKDKYCELTGERISEEVFFKILKTKGLELDESRQYVNNDLNSIFEDCLFYINDTINIVNRVYNMKIKNVYVDSHIGVIKNLDDFTQKKLDVDAKNLVIGNLAINAKDFDIPQEHNLMAVASKYKNEEEFTFSPFTRPPSFSKRQSGKFILACIIGALAGAGYPIYNYAVGYTLQLDSQILSSELSELSVEADRIKAKIEQIKNEQKRVEELNKKEEEKLTFREKLLTEIQDKKNNYSMKGQNIFELTNLINANEVQITAIRDLEQNMTITVVSDNDKKITNLIKDINKVPKYSVDTKKISLNKAANNYESNITIEIMR